MIMRFVESFMSEQPLLGKIEQLKAEGYKEEEIYVLSQNKVEGLAIIDSKTNFIDASGGLGDRISSFFTGKSVPAAQFDSLDLSEIDKEQYIRDIESGNILLFVRKK
ncbi:hypothetical protein EST43_08320 [Macrococcoides canis]|nr:hypothetical protein EST43_08320 [Macrococcus canis]QNR08432.1 hypothetical protein GL258_09200 [Macrococcus canis]QUR95163.1 hypothetical protein GOY09_09570 [Macrococcus canis]